ncbi:MAG: endo-1,4-beta-xylanase [Sphingobacteriaceae bacterium]|nr:endo-1,4-beta-xylanase [Sphingobacteriaceae bacterium]
MNINNLFLKRNTSVVFFAVLLNFTAFAQSQKNGIPLLPQGVKELTNSGNQASGKLVELGDGSSAVSLQVSTFNTASKNNDWKTDIKKEIDRGDILWLHLKARCLQSKRETGEAFVEIYLNRIVEGKYLWPPLLERGESIGSKWVNIDIPFKAENSVHGGDFSSLVLNFGNMPQVVEIKDLTLINYKQTVKYSDLPKSRVRYIGDEPNAAWRKGAAERIEKYRRGNLSVKVVNKKGKPVKDAKITINLTRLDFGIGTATDSERILDTSYLRGVKYRDTLFKYFNKVVLENEIKWQTWGRRDKKRTFTALDTFKARNIPVRGHVMVWPSFEHSPPAIRKLQGDTSAMSGYIVNSIAGQTRELKGQFTEWDVINEPYAHHDYLDLLGRHKMIEWFKVARRGEPNVKLFLNDYTMFHGEGPRSASEKFFENIKYLQDNGAPIEAIGEQGHIGGSPPGMGYIISRLDRFAELGLPIQISEFDITSDDDDFKSRYMKDFMTAVFSHPSVTGFMQWGFWESQHWIPAAALWNKDWSIRPQGKAFTDVVAKEWTTHAKGLSDSNGKFNIRGFNGTYTVTVKKRNKTITKNTVLSSKGNSLTVELDYL